MGADGIDMKLCLGKLGPQILRPYNDRDWKYAGSWENRSHFAYDLLERIKGAVSRDFLIGSWFSSFRGKKNKLLRVEPEKASMFALDAPHRGRDP